MKGSHLGELEELVLLAIAALHPQGYGVSIKEEIKTNTDRRLTLSAIHGALNRLEDKGLVKSRFGGATAERGGKNKRLFVLTALGSRAITRSRAQRELFWKSIPKIALNG